MVRGGDEKMPPGFGQGGLHCLQAAREDRVVERGHDGRHAGIARSPRPGARPGAAEFRDRRAHAAARIGADDPRLGQGAGRGGERDARTCGDIGKPGALGAGHPHNIVTNEKIFKREGGLFAKESF
jgi:hypothetical protein